MKLQVRLLVVFLLAGSQIQAMDFLSRLFSKFTTISGVIAPGDGEGYRSASDFESDEDEVESFKEICSGAYVDDETFDILQPVLQPNGLVHRQSCVFVFYTKENATAQDQEKERRRAMRFITECFYQIRDKVLSHYNALVWIDGTCKIWVIFHQEQAALPHDGLLKDAQTFWNEFLSESYFKQRSLHCVGGIGAITFCQGQTDSGVGMFGQAVQDIRSADTAFDVPENSIIVTPLFLKCQPTLSDQSTNKMFEERSYGVLSFAAFGAALNTEA